MTLTSLITYINALTERERWMVYLGGACLILTLGYALIYSPLNHAITSNQQALHDKQETLAFMKQVKFNPNPHQPQTLSQTQLLTLITEALTKPPFTTYPYTLAQTGSGDIELQFKRVPFNRFLTWAWTLNQQYRFEVKQLNAEKGELPGIVKLTWVISVFSG